jgi:thermostable 8-oxoguanine DNA glycosylase
MQLDYLGNYIPPATLVGDQPEFWDYHFEAIKHRKDPNYNHTENFFKELDYRLLGDYVGYWESIAPATDSEIFQRWLFAFMSVHTSWKANVTGYLAIKDYTEWLYDFDELYKRLVACRVGMQNNRLKYISEFSQKFWNNPENYKKGALESWSEFRNRLMADTTGLGKAKTSFALELCYPNQAKVVCLDTHMFQAYDLDQTADARRYYDVEKHWVEMSSMWNIPPYIARCIYWDLKQGYTDSRYWSFVFEHDNRK